MSAAPWDEEADVVVVGFGGAGACAAIEAADRGASVLVLERFGGGGATRMSGGVIYLGGGTAQQREAGVEDTPDNMRSYLAQEVRDVVSAETLERFCEESPAMAGWLVDRGVPLGGELCPLKTSYPVSRYTLYTSGNERAKPYSENALPAPRGHRTAGQGMPGCILFAALKRAALERGVTLWQRTRVVGLVGGSEGEVEGVVCRRLHGARALLHRLLDGFAYQARYMFLGWPPLYEPLKAAFRWLEAGAREVRVRARGGVVLSGGGFIHNREMVRELAPAYLPGAPLGTLGDDGSAIRMGEDAGGSVAAMDRVSAWRFINPPGCFVEGVLVGPSGARVCNEELYGAHMGEHITEEHDGRAWLVIDRRIWRQAHRELGPAQANWFQSVPALVNLWLNNRRAGSAEALARKCGIEPTGLAETLSAYNETVDSGSRDPLGKSAERFRALRGPLMAIDCSLGSRLFTCASLTLGGLRVDETSGQVTRESGGNVSGLYAAGRSALGVTSRGYVSGLSIADAVFSGRRAGGHAALRSTSDTPA